MPGRNGEDTVPGLPPRARARDLLENGEDVTHVSDRQLVIRAVDSTLATEQTVGTLLGVAARIELRLGRIEERLAPDGEIAQRERQTSSHAIETVADTIAAKVFAEFHGPRGGPNNLTREGVLEIVRATIGDEKLARLERAESDRKKLSLQIKGGLAIGVLMLFITAVVAHFEGRASAPIPAQHAP